MGGLGLAGYAFAKGANTVNAIRSLNYTRPRIKVGKFNLLSGLALEITLDFINNSSEDISIEYFTGNILYRGSNLAAFTFNGNGQNQVIKARSTTSVPFTVLLKTLSAIQVITQIITAITSGGNLSTVITVKGSFYAAGVDVPVNFDYDVKSQTLVSVNGRVAGVGKFPNRFIKKFGKKRHLYPAGVGGFNKSHKKKVRGIGTSSARLSFPNNEEMTNYFRQDQIKKFAPKYGFSKN